MTGARSLSPKSRPLVDSRDLGYLDSHGRKRKFSTEDAQGVVSQSVTSNTVGLEESAHDSPINEPTSKELVLRPQDSSSVPNEPVVNSAELEVQLSKVGHNNESVVERTGRKKKRKRGKRHHRKPQAIAFF